MTLPKAVIFDWDDTIVETWQVVRAAVNHTLESFGHTPWTEEEARLRIGPPARVLFSGLFGEDRWQEADKIYIQAYKDNIGDAIRVHDGAVDVLDAFQRADVPMVVLSSKRGPLLRQEAEVLGLDKYFMALYGAGDSEKDKPHPESVTHALACTGVAAGKGVWLVGDSNTDILCAEDSGCVPVIIKTKPPKDGYVSNAPLEYLFDTHEGLLKILD